MINLLFVFEVNAKFASIKSDYVNTRVGPGKHYPLSWIFVSQGEPVEIKAEFEEWKQICDIKNECSWVHSSLLANKRSIIVLNHQALYSRADESSTVIAKIFPQVRCNFLNYCSTLWCKVKCQNLKGWIKKESVWGLDKEEFTKENKLQLLFYNLF